MVKNECFLNAYRLLNFLSNSWILVRAELLMGLCRQNYLCVKGYFNDKVAQISLYVIEVFIDSSFVKYIF